MKEILHKIRMWWKPQYITWYKLRSNGIVVLVTMDYSEVKRLSDWISKPKVDTEYIPVP